MLTALTTPITDVVNACLLWSFEQTHHNVHNSLYAHCQIDHHLQRASLCIYTCVLQCCLDSSSSSNSSSSSSISISISSSSNSSRSGSGRAAAAQSALLEVKVSSTSNSLVMHTFLPPLCLHCSVALELLPWLHAPCLSCTYNSVAVCITYGIALHQACYSACCLSCASLMMFVAFTEQCMRNCLLLGTPCNATFLC